jgi:predicted DNA-binding protein
MQGIKFTLSITSESAVKKLESLGRKKGAYVSELIEKDIELEELRRRIEVLEGKKKWDGEKIKKKENNTT